jgi:N-acyl homoserine lactone hydrolase
MSGGPAQIGTAVSLDVLHAADMRAPRGWIFRPRARAALSDLRELVWPGRRMLTIPLLAFVIRHPSRGPILVDTGLHTLATDNLRADFGLLNGAFFHSIRPEPETYAEQLRRLGIDPRDVATVVMTHLHADHTSGMRLLPAAEFVCDRVEWEAATSRTAVTGGYVSGHLPPSARMRLVDFEREGEPHRPFQRAVDLLGDGSITLLSTPGHTPGHLSVLVRLAEREVLLIGDAVYTMRSLREELLPLRTVGDRLYLDSLREIKAYAAEQPQALLVPTHDPDAWRQLTA